MLARSLVMAALIGWSLAAPALATPAYRWSAGGGETRLVAGLRVRTQGTAGPPIVFVHGVAGSDRYFGAAFDALTDRARLIAVDLPGFGGSPPSAAGHGPDAMVAALLGCLDGLGVREPVVVMGLSYGTSLGIRLAATQPSRVAAVVGTAPLVYRDRAAAIAGLRRLDPVTRALATDPALARFVLGWARDGRDQALAFGRAVDPKLPPPVLEDALRSDPDALVGAIAEGIVAADLPSWITATRVPIRLLVGSADPTPDRALLAELAARQPLLTLREVPGADHHVMLSHPEECVVELKRAVTLARLARLGQPIIKGSSP